VKVSYSKKSQAYGGAFIDMTQGEILRLIAPKKQTITDAPTLSIDCKAAKYSIIEISANRSADFVNFNTDLEGHILQVKHLVAGTSITLPGANNVSGNWAENIDDITMVACFYNGTSWIFELTPVLAGAALSTLATPTGFALTPGNASMGIVWNAVANATGYVLQSSLDGSSWTQVYSGSATSQNFTGLTNGQLYYYRVKATAPGYNDSAFASGSATPDVGSLPQLATPTGLTITPSDSLLALDWNNVTNATGYVVQRATDAGFTANLSTTNLSGGTNSSYNQFASPNGTLFYVRVKATAAGYTDSDWVSGSGTPSAGSSYDSDAQAFITAVESTGVTLSTTIKDAVNGLELAVKAIGRSKFKAVYPLVGGTAAAQARNLINPADSNAAHRITWAGTLTHNANGVTGDGASGYGDLNYNPSTAGMTTSSAHISAYVRACTANNGNGNAVIGAKESTNEVLLVSDFANLTYASLFNNTDYLNQSPTTGRTGMFVVSRQSSSSAKFWRNGTLLEEVTGAPGDLPNGKTLLLNQAEGNTPQAAFSDANVAFVSLGSALSDADETALRNAVVAFQTALGRNV
jgi:hypothetical protein